MMSTTRLKTLRRQEQKQRKVMGVMNGVVKVQHQRFDCLMEKEKHEAVQKCDKTIVHTRRNIVRQRVLKKCMAERREEVERKQASKLFGKYHGETVENISGHIDTYLEQNHPKVRRQQKIQDMFQSGYDSGAILDNDTMENKVRNYFSRPLIHVRHYDAHSKRDDVIQSHGDDVASGDGRSFPALSKAFYTGNRKGSWNASSQDRYETIEEISEPDEHDDETRDSASVRQKMEHFLHDDIPDDNASVQSDQPKATAVMTSCARPQRPITLPPIKLGTDNSQPNGKPQVDCITELIDRLHKAKDDREKAMKIKKEKRAKRLQAERVHGFGGMEAHAGEFRHGGVGEANNANNANNVNNWQVYEANKNELLSSISNSKKTIQQQSDAEQKHQAALKEARLYFPPLKVAQKSLLSK